ncbi:Lrp/AsnC family transcriptional regulator [Brevundimonas terrae]|jgi:DNA-binding Lrp family transcriptional regulator|uniref:Lrp/AsnC family transcriptional regulator n=1 Tax=Brevundimonas terrae TaxID=363631 RepID=A0ABN0YAU0_9CAUL|nr:Lrp/AsnC family transcriptional regulator [Brevundimonas terrae]NIJ26233.1 DNA-binding Lrp family transcriptional regulator [Brevundimonas terrae]
MQETVILDEFDRRLLDLVRRNNLTPARVLAEKVGLSESAVSRRLRRLRDEKIIIADVAVVDRGRLEKALTMHVLVEMEREGTAVIDALMRKLKARPEVHGMWYTTGHVDFILYVVVPDMQAYDTFTRDALNDDARVRNFTTLLTIREVMPFDPSQRVISRGR